MPDLEPIILSAACVPNIVFGENIVVNPSLFTENEPVPNVLLTWIGLLNITLPVASVVPIIISLLGSLILI